MSQKFTSGAKVCEALTSMLRQKTNRTRFGLLDVLSMMEITGMGQSHTVWFSMVAILLVLEFLEFSLKSYESFLKILKN